MAKMENVVMAADRLQMVYCITLVLMCHASPVDKMTGLGIVKGQLLHVEITSAYSNSHPKIGYHIVSP